MNVIFIKVGDLISASGTPYLSATEEQQAIYNQSPPFSLFLQNYATLVAASCLFTKHMKVIGIHRLTPGTSQRLYERRAPGAIQTIPALFTGDV